MGEHGRKTKLGFLLRVGVFAFLCAAGLVVFPTLIFLVGDRLLGAALGTFTAAAVANAIVLRIYERGSLADIGMQWNGSSRRNLLLGCAGGVGAGCLVVGVPLAVGLAEIRPDPEYPGSVAAFFFVSLVLLFGAAGEEMLFRGYGFQALVAAIGPFATILPVSFVFAWMHSANDYASTLGLVNTFGWGVVLGVAFLRSGDLWFPIGLHFGWNWVLPIFGVSVSGFTMNTVGYAIDWSVGDLWSGGAYGPEGGLLTTLVLFVLAGYLWKAPIHGQPAFLLHSRRED